MTASTAPGSDASARCAPTWRANPDWAAQLGYDADQLDAVNRSAVRLAEEIRTAAAADGITAVVSGCVGPRGDGYDPGAAMTPEDAERYHAVQIGTFASTTADQVTAITMTNAEEAIGVVRAAGAAGVPAAISFTTETDGRLPSGQRLRDAIDRSALGEIRRWLLGFEQRVLALIGGLPLRSIADEITDGPRAHDLAGVCD